MKTIKTLLKYLFFRNRIKDPKPINAETAKYFIQGHIRSFAKNFGIVEDRILEQASWRETLVKEKNPKCYENGACEYCECPLKESLISDSECKHGCYPRMLSKLEWEKAKEINNIKF